jgi:hypothetical protein
MTTSRRTLIGLDHRGDDSFRGRYSLPDVTAGPIGRNFLITSSGDFVFGAGDRIARVTLSDCTEGTELCLDGRFTAEVRWKSGANPAGSSGNGVPLTQNAGYFWFFSPNNVEIVVKLVDGREVNGHYWLFVASLTDVEFTLTVTDHATGTTVEHTKPAGTLESIANLAAF